MPAFHRVSGCPFSRSKQWGLERQDKSGVSAFVEPAFDLFREISAERYQANAALAGADPEVGSLEVDIDQTQSQCLAKSQAGAVKNEE